jgi:hypothetical protein
LRLSAPIAFDASLTTVFASCAEAAHEIAITNAAGITHFSNARTLNIVASNQ